MIPFTCMRLERACIARKWPPALIRIKFPRIGTSQPVPPDAGGVRGSARNQSRKLRMISMNGLRGHDGALRLFHNENMNGSLTRLRRLLATLPMEESAPTRSLSSRAARYEAKRYRARQSF
jgi:hypothetical protein